MIVIGMSIERHWFICQDGRGEAEGKCDDDGGAKC